MKSINKPSFVLTYIQQMPTSIVGRIYSRSTAGSATATIRKANKRCSIKHTGTHAEFFVSNKPHVPTIYRQQ